MAKKFIRGTFELEQNVTDLEAFEKPKLSHLNYIINWATDNGVKVIFGTSEDNTYLCEFEAVANTVQMCKGYVTELKSMLKTIFPKANVIVEWRGEKLW